MVPLTGGFAGYKAAKAQGINPWTGKYEGNSIVIGRNMQNRVDPAAKDLGAETITGDWGAEFGKSRISDKQGLDFNYKWFDEKLNSNYKIFDIGSGNINNYNHNYMMELNTLQFRSYPSTNTYFRSFFGGKVRFNYFR